MSAYFVKTVFCHNKKGRTTLPDKVPRPLLNHPGNPAICLRPVAFRPRLTMGLALSWYNFFLDDYELVYKYVYFICIGIFKIIFRKIFTIQDFF
jgi:hypothetical protein